MRTGVYYKATGGCMGLIQNFSVIPDPPAHATMGVAARDEFARDLYGAFSVKRLFWVCCQFFVRSGKAVLRPVACNQVRGARGRGQGTEPLAELGGLPP